MENQVNKNLDTLFTKMENFVSTKTVVGEPIKLDNIVILPLVDVVFGVGAGGGSETEAKASGGGGGGLGAKINPSAVIVIIDDTVQVLNLKNQDSLSKLIDMAPGVINKLGINNLFNKVKKGQADVEEVADIKFEKKEYFEEDGELKEK